MEFSTQVKTFLVIAATGMLLGVLFDTYRVLRRRYKPHWLLTSISDLIYCLLASAIAFAALVMSNWGELRFYVIIALFTGILSYYRLASQIVMRFIVLQLTLLGKIWRTAQMVFAFTIVKPVRLLVRTALWPVRFMGRRVRRWYKRWRPPPPPPAEEIPPPG